LNLNDTLPELIRSAREIITSTADIRQYEATRSDIQAGYSLDAHQVSAIATESLILEKALLRVEQTLADIEADRRQLEAAFAAMTSDDQEELSRKPLVHRITGEPPVVTATPIHQVDKPPPAIPQAPVSVTAEAPPPVPRAIAPARAEPKTGEKSAKKTKRCKKCHKRKKCVCD